MLFGFETVDMAEDHFPIRLDDTNEWIDEGRGDKAMTLVAVDLKWSSNVDLLSRKVGEMKDAWNNGSVPVVSWLPDAWASPITIPSPNDDITRVHSQEYQVYLDHAKDSFVEFVRGNDGAFGTEDDRRFFLRFAPEANGCWHPWCSQCNCRKCDHASVSQDASTYKRLWDFSMSRHSCSDSENAPSSCLECQPRRRRLNGRVTAARRLQAQPDAV